MRVAHLVYSMLFGMSSDLDSVSTGLVKPSLTLQILIDLSSTAGGVTYLIQALSIFQIYSSEVSRWPRSGINTCFIHICQADILLFPTITDNGSSNNPHVVRNADLHAVCDSQRRGSIESGKESCKNLNDLRTNWCTESQNF